jgi:hypothetical protein
MSTNHYITAEDVRNFMLDRSAKDNPVQLDLVFAETEIDDAMRRAARDYNSLPPYTIKIDPTRLPGDTNIFLDAIAEQLCISRMSKLMRQDFDFVAGGVETNQVRTEISHLKSLIELYGTRWREPAKQIKATIALNTMWAHY